MRHFFFIDPSCWVLDISAGISLGRSYGSIKYVVDLLMFTPEIATDYLRIWTPCRYICLPVITIVLYDSGYVTSFFFDRILWLLVFPRYYATLTKVSNICHFTSSGLVLLPLPYIMFDYFDRTLWYGLSIFNHDSTRFGSRSSTMLY